VVDSYAWIELFTGSDKGEKVREYMEKSEEVYTPDIVLAEVARKYIRENVSEEIVKNRLAAIKEVSEICCVDGDTALEAAKCYVELLKVSRRENLRDPSLFDAIVLALARKLGAKLISGDAHFKGLEEVLWVG